MAGRPFPPYRYHRQRARLLLADGSVTRTLTGRATAASPVSRSRQLCGTLAEHGVFNVLLSDSKCLYVSAADLVGLRAVRRSSGDLIDEDLTVDFRKETTPHDIVTVIATRALTRDEQWVSVARRKFVAFQGGELAFRWPRRSGMMGWFGENSPPDC